MLPDRKQRPYSSSFGFSPGVLFLLRSVLDVFACFVHSLFGICIDGVLRNAIYICDDARSSRSSPVASIDTLLTGLAVGVVMPEI